MATGPEVHDSDGARARLAAVPEPGHRADVDVADFATFDLLPHPAFVVEVGGDAFRFVYANAAYEALLPPGGVGPGDLRSVLPADAIVAHMRAFARAVRNTDAVSFEVDWSTGLPHRTLSVNITPIIGADGACTHLVGAAFEITDRRSLERRLARQVRFDPITDLPNRVMLVEWLDDALLQCATGQRVGLIVLDIDHFKIVNDSLGPEAGDELLAVVAGRVDRLLRGGDRIARLGGDELAVVAHRVNGVDDAMALADRIDSVFDEPFSVSSGDEVYLAASIGVVLSKGQSDTPARLLRDADVAVFAAKEMGRGRIEVFDETMRERTVRRLEFEAELRRALVRDEFAVHYQPIVHFDSSDVVGFEALVRWEHPAYGLELPNEFLPVAEQTGLIVPIGAFVIERACAQMAAWRDEAPGAPALWVSVNVAARQLLDADFLEVIDTALATSAIEPSQLVLEISENALVEHRDAVADVLMEVAERGVQIAIDHFGTGRSSLGHLRDMPVQSLKLDQSFVHALGDQAEDRAVVAAVVNVGHAFGLTVIAEGVETAAQLDALRALGCDAGQGYYFAKPQPSEVVQALVHHRFRWSAHSQSA